MKQSLRKEVRELAIGAFEDIQRDYIDDLRYITDSWNVPFPQVEDMFAELLGNMLINYSQGMR